MQLFEIFQITWLGYVLIPAGIAAFFFAPRQTLFYALVFFAPFTATAVVNIPAIKSGVQPAYFLGILFIVRSLVQALHRQAGGGLPRQESKSLLPFWLFCVAAFFSIAAIPLYDTVMVLRPSGLYEYLALSRQHLTQFMYLLYVTVLLTCIGLSGMNAAQIRTTLKVFVASGLFVSLWGWFQVVCRYTAIPYPDLLFNSSLSFSQSYAVDFNGLQRISSVAPEPSMFARFMLVPTFISLYSVYRKGFLTKRSRALLLSCFFLVTLLGCISSTAYLGLAGGFFLLLWIMSHEQEDSIIKLSGMFRRFKGLVAILAFLLVLLVSSLVITWVALDLDVGSASRLIDIMVINKAETTSGQLRLEGLRDGLRLFSTHPLLGVGWGSNRTFDLGTYILANTGLIGALLFFGGHLSLARRALRTGQTLDRHGYRGVGAYPRVLVLALAVVLFGKMLSEPDVIYLDHWILVGVLIAALSLALPAARPRRRSAARMQALPTR